MFPERSGYLYGGSSYAGTRIHHPGAIGDVSKKPVNKFDWIWREHDIYDWVGQFETGTKIRIHPALPPAKYYAPHLTYISTRAEIIHPKALKATADEMERRKPGSSRILLEIVGAKLRTEASSHAKHKWQEFYHDDIPKLLKRSRLQIWGTVLPAINAVLTVNSEGNPQANVLAGKIFDRGVLAIAALEGAMAVAGLLPPQVASEEVFAQLLPPTDSSADDSEGGKLAVRVSDIHECPAVTATVAHVGGPVSTGADNIYIGGKLAARLGDTLVCQGPPDTMCMGSGSVFWNGRPAVRVADATTHGGKTVAGDTGVYIG